MCVFCFEISSKRIECKETTTLINLKFRRVTLNFLKYFCFYSIHQKTFRYYEKNEYEKRNRITNILLYKFVGMCVCLMSVFVCHFPKEIDWVHWFWLISRLHWMIFFFLTKSWFFTEWHWSDKGKNKKRTNFDFFL